MMELKADLHCHTTFSDGWGTPEECIEQAKGKGLDILAITDHRTAAGGLKYWKKQPSNGLTVIPGEEIRTEEGHILAFFVKSTIEDCSLEEAVAKAREQDALLYATHLYHLSFQRFPWGESRKTFFDREILLLNGIESRNSHAAWRCNRDTVRYAAAHSEIGALGGSDAHFTSEIGNAWTVIQSDTRSLDGIKKAMACHKTEAAGPTLGSQLFYRWVYYVYSYGGHLVSRRSREASQEKRRRTRWRRWL